MDDKQEERKNFMKRKYSSPLPEEYFYQPIVNNLNFI